MLGGSEWIIIYAASYFLISFASAIGFVLILLFVPETKSLSLEELDRGKLISRRVLGCGTDSLISLQCSDSQASRTWCEEPSVGYSQVPVPPEDQRPPSPIWEWRVGGGKEGR